MRCFVVLNDVLRQAKALRYDCLTTNCPEKFQYTDPGDTRPQVGSLVYCIRSICTTEPHRFPSAL
jgi:hypothetical protein